MNPSSSIRPPAVAGAFYPLDARELQDQIHTMLATAAREQANLDSHIAGLIKALIVPHAGYPYSGPVAARAYHALAARAPTVRRVVLLGPTHRVPVRGLALPSCQALATPLGTVPVDTPSRALLAGLPQVVENDASHALEHSLEVQLPFLQTLLRDFTLVPLAVGQATPEEVAEVLEHLWGGEETLILISSDLTHFLPYDMARIEDKETVAQMLKLAPHIDHQHACGATPVNGLLLAARRHGLRPQLLDLRNSGDTEGDPSRVVGYAALAFRVPHVV